MKIRIYSPWKNLTNIWTNEYICQNIFEYIQISKYLSHTELYHDIVKQLLLKCFSIEVKKKTEQDLKLFLIVFWGVRATMVCLHVVFCFNVKVQGHVCVPRRNIFTKKIYNWLKLAKIGYSLVCLAKMWYKLQHLAIISYYLLYMAIYCYT